MSIGQHKEVAIPSLEQVKREREKLKYQKEYRRTIKHVLGVLLVAAAVSVLLATVFFPILRVSQCRIRHIAEKKNIHIPMPVIQIS